MDKLNGPLCIVDGWNTNGLIPTVVEKTTEGENPVTYREIENITFSIRRRKKWCKNNFERNEKNIG